MIQLLTGVVAFLSGASHNENYLLTQPALPIEKISFLEAHQAEITDMYQSKLAIGTWKELGKGVSKKVFEHPDLPGMVIKIPVSIAGHRGMTGEDDLRIHHSSLSQIRSIADQYDRIHLPESYLYHTESGLILVEEKISFADYAYIPDGIEKVEAMNQFNAFTEAVNLCDINPEENHNAGIMTNTMPPTIGIIDVDCRQEYRLELF